MTMQCFSFFGNRQKTVILAVFLQFLLFFLVSKPALCGTAGQPGSEQTFSISGDALPELTIEALEERIRIANQAPNLSPESKQRIVVFYQKAIEIPFAQRDTHLDTGGGPLDIRLVNEKETP